MPTLAFYVNPDGSGHRRRVLQFIAALKRPVHVITREDKAEYFRDNPLITVHTVTQAEIMELYRVLRESEGRGRAEETAQYKLLREINPALMHIDVCTEVAEVARALEIPYTFTLMHGDRMKDEAHRTAYTGAQQLIAPYPEALRDATLPVWIHDKTTYCGLMSARAVSPDSVETEAGTITCVVGKGFASGYANALSAGVLTTLAEEFGEYTFRVLGEVTPGASAPANVEYLGFVHNPTTYLQKAQIVLGTTGYNVLSEVAQLNACFVTVPAKTPFDEQLVKARLLDRLNYAVCVEEVHNLDAWRRAFERVGQMQAIRELYNPEAARVAAGVLSTLQE